MLELYDLTSKPIQHFHLSCKRKVLATESTTQWNICDTTCSKVQWRKYLFICHPSIPAACLTDCVMKRRAKHGFAIKDGESEFPRLIHPSTNKNQRVSGVIHAESWVNNLANATKQMLRFWTLYDLKEENMINRTAVGASSPTEYCFAIYITASRTFNFKERK